MANSLLDFVMSVVRDPDVAARYAQDPAQAISDAHLVGVTSADVDNLIPVVSESLTMSMPTLGGADISTIADGNIWASGAATAAFDAFADHLPDPVVASVGGVVDPGITHVADVSVEVPSVDPVFDEPAIDAMVDPVANSVVDTVAPLGTEVLDHGLGGHPAPGFDIFE